MPDGDHIETSRVDAPMRTTRCNAPIDDPWQVIHRAMMAEQADDDLLVFAGSAPGAREVTDLLEEPWKYRTDTGVVLYEWDDPILLENNQGLVAPADMDPYGWHLDPDGELRLENGTGIAAHGAAHQVPQNLEYDLPRAIPDEPETMHTSWEVRTPDGRELGSYTDFWAMLGEWNRINTPCIPSRLTYSNAVGGYRADGEVHAVPPNHPADLQAAASHFVDRFTVEMSGHQLSVETLVDRFQDWYAPPGSADSFTDDEVCAALLDGAEVVGDGDSRTGGNRSLRNRTWIYPTSLYDLGLRTPFGRF